MTSGNRRVLIVQAHVAHYRVPLFEQLGESLQKRGIELSVGYGQPSRVNQARSDAAELNSGYGLRVKNRWLGNDRFLYQPLSKVANEHDLVIVEQANKHVLNYQLLLRRATKQPMVAYWGHGRDRLGADSSFSIWLKRRLATKADWWFAYNNTTADYIAQIGFSPHRITVVDNAIDTSLLRADLAAITPTELAEAKRSLGLSPQSRIGLYVGALSREKRLDLLFESARQIKHRLPGFDLLVMGDGPQRALAEQAANRESWIHYLGPKFGTEKALAFRMADMFLHPGAVGLAILDAQAAGLPFLTTSLGPHGPEIDRLQPEVNGSMVEDDPVAIAVRAVEWLSDPALLATLSQGARQSALTRDLAAMVEAFASGIQACLQLR